MLKRVIVTCGFLFAVVGAPKPAMADWLLTGFIGPITNVKTDASTGSTRTFPAEKFDSSRGFGVNLASAFPTKGNVGFELDWGVYNKGMERSDIAGTQFASKLMSVSTNFFYSPSIPRVRPYFSAGPNFVNRSDITGTVRFAAPSSWAVGMDAGGGVMAFVNEHIAGRLDLRYYRNFGDFVDLKNVSAGGQSWNNLQFFRVFVGATAVLR